MAPPFRQTEPVTPAPALTLPPLALHDLPAQRQPATVLAAHRERFGARAPVWIFGYASLIWRPEFEADEHRPAVVSGWHRCLRMRSRVNRGTPQQPGLVFALMSGGACRGVVYRLPPRDLDAQFERLWAREMPTGVYEPRWLQARTAIGVVPALAFTLSRRSPNWTGPIEDPQMLHILQHARGRYGTTLDYLLQTAHALRAHGVQDREVERLVRLARRHGLAAADQDKA
ncbi:MAG: gamma-glutamylcyclotransferase [Rubrivivax sp.]|nr:gamma-glutamylcyclotransferase [Rubrivivax sp.]